MIPSAKLHTKFFLSPANKPSARQSRFQHQSKAAKRTWQNRNLHWACLHTSTCPCYIWPQSQTGPKIPISIGCHHPNQPQAPEVTWPKHYFCWTLFLQEAFEPSTCVMFQTPHPSHKDQSFGTARRACLATDSQAKRSEVTGMLFGFPLSTSCFFQNNLKPGWCGSKLAMRLKRRTNYIPGSFRGATSCVDHSTDNSKMYLRVLLHNRGDPGPPWPAAKMVPIPLAESTQPHESSTSPPPALVLLSSEQLPGSLGTALLSKGRCCAISL